MSNVILQPPRYAFNSLFSLLSFFLSDYQLVSKKQLTSTINQLLHRFQQKLIASTLNSLGGKLTAMVTYFHLCDIYTHSVPSFVKSKISHIANPPISSNDSPSIIPHLQWLPAPKIQTGSWGGCIEDTIPVLYRWWESPRSGLS